MTTPDMRRQMVHEDYWQGRITQARADEMLREIDRAEAAQAVPLYHFFVALDDPGCSARFVYRTECENEDEARKSARRAYPDATVVWVSLVTLPDEH